MRKPGNRDHSSASVCLLRAGGKGQEKMREKETQGREEKEE